MVILRPAHWLVVDLKNFVMSETISDGRLTVTLLLPVEEGEEFLRWVRERIKEEEEERGRNAGNGQA